MKTRKNRYLNNKKINSSLIGNFANRTYTDKQLRHKKRA